MPIIPRNVVAEPAISPGALCMYENDGRPLLAVVVAFRKQKYAVLNQRGREMELPAFRLHLLPGKMPADTGGPSAQAAFLDTLFTQANTASNAVNLEELWTVVSSEIRDYSAQELCALVHPNATLEEYLAVRLALISDRIYFKRHEEGFAPRPAGTVEELKKSEHSRLEKLRLQDLALQSFREAIAKKKATLPAEIQLMVRTLLEVAAGCSEIDNGRLKDAKELVDFCAEKLQLNLHGSREQRMISFLEATYVLTPNTNLSFVRHRYQFERSPAVLQQAQAIPSVPDLESGAQRLDLTTIPCYTIDDAATLDMDDAIALQHLPDRLRLSIHISDVAQALPIGSDLDRDALRRATSVYCPEVTANMLPDELSQDKLSLVAGRRRFALSCIVDFDRNHRIIDTRVARSVIQVSKRLSYDEVDAQLDDPASEFQAYHLITASLEAERIANGAMSMGKREMLAVVDSDTDFHLVEIDENSPARSMVGELMVLANTIFARYAVEHSIPLIFRGQDEPDPQDGRSIDEVPEGPAHDYRLRAQMKKSFTSVEPVRHASLALDAYIQATSPIRRYADLVNQRQISAHLVDGTWPHNSQELIKLIEALDEPLAKAQAISKETRRFWLLRHLEKLATQNINVTATVLRTDMKNPLIEIHEVVMPTVVRLDRKVKPGDMLHLRIVKVDPRNDFLRLEEVKK